MKTANLREARQPASPLALPEPKSFQRPNQTEDAFK